MSDHKIPTQEELDAGIQKAVEEADKPEVIEEETPDEEKTTETPQEKEEEATKEEPEEKEEELEEEEPEKKVEAPKKEEKKEEEPVEKKPDLKTRYDNSTREAQILHAQNKRLQKAMQDSANVPEPTADEIKSEFPTYDDMTDTEKALAKKTVWQDKRQRIIDDAAKEGQNYEQWVDKVDEWIGNPQVLVDHPELEDKIEEFKVFASKPTRRGLDFEDLTLAFMGDYQKNIKPKSKGAMFESGTRGSNEKPKPKSDKITTEQSIILRKTNYKKYMEYLNAGKIQDPA